MDVHRASPGTQQPSLPPLSIGSCRFEATQDAEEPLTPTARLFQDMYIVTEIGLAKPIDLDAFRAGLDATLLRHPRFCSIRVRVAAHDISTSYSPDDIVQFVTLKCDYSFDCAN